VTQQAADQNAPIGNIAVSAGRVSPVIRIFSAILSLGLILGVGSILAVSCGPKEADAGPSLEGGAEQHGLVLRETEPTKISAEGIPSRPDFHSFGLVPDGATAKHTFLLHNVESFPVSITGLHPGCGCTAPSVRVIASDGTVTEGQKPREAGDVWAVVPAGADVEVSLSVDTRDISQKNTDRTVVTRLTTDAKVGRYRTFEVHLRVLQDLQITPKQMNLGDVAVGIGASKTIDVVPLGDKDTELINVLSSPEGVRVEIVASEIMGQPTWEILASLDPPLELGPVIGMIKIETRRLSGGDGHPLDIPFLAKVVPDLNVSPARLVLHNDGLDDRLERLGPGSTVELSSRRPGERLVVLESRVEGVGAEAFGLRVEPLDPDAKGRGLAWSVSLIAPEEWPTEIRRGEVVLELERSSEGEVRIPWVCHPRVED
jgi:hypothetical protein